MRPLLRLLFPALLACAAHAAQTSERQPVVPDWKHVKPSAEWVYYTLERTPQERPPYLIACRPGQSPDSELAVRVRANNIQEFLAEQEAPDGTRARIPTLAAAEEALRIVMGGRVVESEGAATRAFKAARKYAEFANAELKSSEAPPRDYGIISTESPTGWRLTGVFLFTEPSLIITHVGGRVLKDGHVRMKKAYILSVPRIPDPRGEGAAPAFVTEEQAALPLPASAFDVYKRTVAASLDERRSSKAADKLVHAGMLRAEIVDAIGAPDERIDDGTWLFDLHDCGALLVRFDAEGRAVSAHRLERKVDEAGRLRQHGDELFGS